MIIGGVLFGFFAALPSGFQKFLASNSMKVSVFTPSGFGSGFLVAFMPLYMLGLMGATRRLNHYVMHTGWHPFFLLVAIGALLIAIGIGLQMLQISVSVKVGKAIRYNRRSVGWSNARMVHNLTPSYL